MKVSQPVVVIVGGGTAGCMVTSYLANNTDAQLVLIEPEQLSPHDDTSQFFDVVNEKYLGGGSAINGLLLTGDEPEFARGLTRVATEKDAGPMGRLLLSNGGRFSRMWWNNGRWNPGRAVEHLRQGGRIRIVHETVEKVVVRNGSVTGVVTPTGIIEADFVVLTAGALITPKILFNSEISELQDRIGVGLQNHPCISFTLALDECSVATFDACVVRESQSLSGQHLMMVAYERASSAENKLGLFTVALMSPLSRGVFSGTSEDQQADYRFLEDPKDLASMREGVQDLVQMLRNSYKGDVFVDDDGTQLDRLFGLSDIQLDEWIQRHVTPLSHAASSCSAVIDESGRVLGVTGLFVADASALAQVPSCTPAAPVTLEALRIAEILREEFA